MSKSKWIVALAERQTIVLRDEDESWRVIWEGVPCTPAFTARGAAEACLDMYRSGRRRPELPCAPAKPFAIEAKETPPAIQATLQYFAEQADIERVTYMNELSHLVEHLTTELTRLKKGDLPRVDTWSTSYLITAPRHAEQSINWQRAEAALRMRESLV